MGGANSLPADKRGFHRSTLSSNATFVLGEESYPCSLINISAGGAALASKVRPAPESKIVLLVQGLDPLRARVTRGLVEGFAVEFEFSDEDQDRITDQLLYLSDLRQFF